MLSNLTTLIAALFGGLLSIGLLYILLTKTGPKYHIFNPKPKEYEVAPALSGTLLKNGEILANTRIVRVYNWNPNKNAETDEATTDENGYFSFPSVEKTLALTPLAQHSFFCELTLENKKGEPVWRASNFAEHKYFEDESSPNQMTCDILDEEITVRVGNTPISTKCRWNGLSI